MNPFLCLNYHCEVSQDPTDNTGTCLVIVNLNVDIMFSSKAPTFEG